MKLILTLGLAFLYLPIVILVVFSFTGAKIATLWGGFSLEWYGKLFANRAMMEAAFLSLKVALFSATLATIIGTLASFSLLKTFKGKKFFEAGLAAPLILPEVIMALALMLFFIALEIPRGEMTIIIAHTTFTLCFVVIIVSSRLKSFDFTQVEAAQDLGATISQAYVRVCLPQIYQSIIAGWLLAFTLSLDDLILASFVSGAGSTTLPMRIYSQARLGVTPEINALSTLILVFVTVLIVTASLLLAPRHNPKHIYEKP